MKFGANTLIWSESFGPEQFPLLERIKAAGLDGVEIPVFDPGSVDAAEIRRALDGAGLECTACSVIPRGLSLTDEDSMVRRKARAHVEASIRAAAAMGASLLAGPMYSPVGYFSGQRRTDGEWGRAVECWRELAPKAAAAGIEIAIEPLNRFETYFLNTAADAAALCDDIGSPAVGILLDTFHANIEEKSVGAALGQAGRHLKHLHTCENDRGTPGTGNVDWPGFFEAIGALGYDGWLTIESFGFRLGGIAAAASIWRDLAPSPEDIAFEGVRFLRRNAAGAAAAGIGGDAARVS